MSSKTLSAATPSPPPDGAPTPEWLERQPNACAVTSYVINVTPDMAKQWLQQNVVGDKHNRRFRPSRMRGYAMEMRKGQWRLTHQGIAFSRTGRLVDGQHRLAAIVECDKPQLMLIFTDVEDEGFANFDRGAPRDMGDVLLQDPKVVSLAQILARLCVRGTDEGRRAMPAEISTILQTYAADISALYEASPTRVGPRNAAPIRAAWVVRHHSASDIGKKRLRAQWRAFIDMDLKTMDDATAAGIRRFDNLSVPRGATGQNQQLSIAWLMFDPEDRDRSVVRLSTAALTEIRAAVRHAIPTLTPDAGEGRRPKNRPKTRTLVAGSEIAKKWYPMSDPSTGPALRAKALAAIEARKAMTAGG